MPVPDTRDCHDDREGRGGLCSDSSSDAGNAIPRDGCGSSRSSGHKASGQAVMLLGNVLVGVVGIKAVATMLTTAQNRM